VSLGNNGNSLSLDDLIALNEEMAALVRAGVPLEIGMSELGSDLPGSLGHLAKQIGERLSQGESLTQILEDDRRSLPTVWRAVVESGLRAGNLPAALEAMATTGLNLVDMRRSLLVALVYPLVVVSIAYASFVFLTTFIAPAISTSFEQLTDHRQPVLSWLNWIGGNANWWVIWVPAVAAFALGLWWFRSSRAHVISSSRLMRWPVSMTMLRNCRLATFTAILGMLVRQQVPFHEAIVLASQASGDRRLRKAGATVAARLHRGEPLSTSDADLLAFPPLLGWLIAYGGQSETLSIMLLEMAERYRNEAQRAACWSAVYLPIILTVGVGGTVTLLQAFAIFVPLTQLLTDLANFL